MGSSIGWTARRTRATAEVLKVACYGPSRGRIMILDTVVPATVAYREAASAQQPVHRWEPTRHPTPSGLESMLSLVRELPVGLDKAALSPADVTRRLKP
jgi:chromosome partitioning related protein ParA